MTRDTRNGNGNRSDRESRTRGVTREKRRGKTRGTIALFACTRARARARFLPRARSRGEAVHRGDRGRNLTRGGSRYADALW